MSYDSSIIEDREYMDRSVHGLQLATNHDLR